MLLRRDQGAGAEADVPRHVEGQIGALRGRLYEAMFDADVLVTFEEMRSTLSIVRQRLVDDYSSLYIEDLDAFIDRSRIFRTHFATIDIRQNHAVHKRLVERVLAGLPDVDMEGLSDDALVEALLRTDIDVQEEDLGDELLIDTVRTIRAVGRIQERNGEEGCDRYVISHAEDTWSVLFVFALFRWIWKSEDLPIDIIPLFESMTGMTNASDIMTDLFELATYREHVTKRGNQAYADARFFGWHERWWVFPRQLDDSKDERGADGRMPIPQCRCHLFRWPRWPTSSRRR